MSINQAWLKPNKQLINKTVMTIYMCLAVWSCSRSLVV